MEIEGKSRTLSFCLTFLFGPIGLIYASPKFAIALTAIMAMFLETVIVPLVCWALAIVAGDYFIAKYNNGLQRFNAMLNINEH